MELFLSEEGEDFRDKELIKEDSKEIFTAWNVNLNQQYCAMYVCLEEISLHNEHKMPTHQSLVTNL